MGKIILEVMNTVLKVNKMRGMTKMKYNYVKLIKKLVDMIA